MAVRGSVDVVVLFVGTAESGIGRTLSGLDGVACRPVDDVTAALAALGEADCLLTTGGATGTEAISRVRDAAPDYPILAVLDDPADAAACLDAGATDCLTADLARASRTTLATRIESVVGSVDGRMPPDCDEQYKALIDHSSDIVTVVDPDGSVTYQSPSVQRILGWDPDELLGDSVYNYVHPDDRETVREQFVALLQQEGGVVEDVTYRFRCADGSWRWLETVGSNRKDTALGGYVFNSRDVTDRRQRKADLAAGRELLDLSLDTIDEVFYLVDGSGTLRRWNESLERVTGYSGSELEEKHALELFAEADRDRITAAAETVIESGRRAGPVEASMVTTAGETIPFEFTGAPFSTPEGEGRWVVGIGRDVSGRERRERELERYETIVQAIPDEVYTLDADGCLTSLAPPSDRDLSVTEYEPKELVGEHVSTVMDEADVAAGSELIEELLREGRRRGSFEMDLVTRGGDRIPFENHVALLPGDDGEFHGTVGVLRDVSDRKAREREHERAETIFQNAQDGIVLVDVIEGGRFEIQRVNPAYEAMSGLDEAAIRGKSPREVLGSELGNEIEARFTECVQRQAPLAYDETFDIPDVPTHWHTKISPVVVDGTVERIVVTTRDVTERKERERRLELREEAMEAAPIGITIADRTRPNTPIVYANSGFERLTGYDGTEIAGRNWSFLTGADTDAAALGEITAAIDRTESATAELVYYRKDGTPFWCRVSVAPVRSVGGDVTHYVGFMQDVTESKEYEQQIERRFDEFSEVLASDLREPLEKAQSHLAAAESNGADDAVAAASEWLDRADTLLDDLTTVHSFSVESRELSEATRRGSREEQ